MGEDEQWERRNFSENVISHTLRCVYRWYIRFTAGCGQDSIITAFAGAAEYEVSKIITINAAEL